MYVRSSEKIGTFLRSPDNKDDSILGSISGPPISGNPHVVYAYNPNRPLSKAFGPLLNGSWKSYRGPARSTMY